MSATEPMTDLARRGGMSLPRPALPLACLSEPISTKNKRAKP